MLCVEPEGVSLTAQGQMFSLMNRHAGNRVCSASQEAVVTVDQENAVTATLVNASFCRENLWISLSTAPAGGHTLHQFHRSASPAFEKRDIWNKPGTARCMPPHSVLLLRF